MHDACDERAREPGMQARATPADGSSFLILNTFIVRGMALLVPLVFSTTVMANTIFIQSKNAATGRTAILDDDGKVAYLYLTAPSGGQIERDVIAYMRVQAIGRLEWTTLMAEKSTPLLTADVASAAAVIQHADGAEFELKWSADGNAVALLRLGQPLAFASAAEQRGYSKAVAVDSAWARPWEQLKYDHVFSAGAVTVRP